eukprot:TRINITY_DN110302_c0_g1_i1.p1 TRINITY_DN110302_c0_g1~~TRINITY_DN110302_c0_g1_i1.p1  ORF type:complete len:172 (+),score=45.87 TRINITY_DN110302_c0_g1_i1:81-596(+)
MAPVEVNSTAKKSRAASPGARKEQENVEGNIVRAPEDAKDAKQNEKQEQAEATATPRIASLKAQGAALKEKAAAVKSRAFGSVGAMVTGFGDVSRKAKLLSAFLLLLVFLLIAVWMLASASMKDATAKVVALAEPFKMPAVVVGAIASLGCAGMYGVKRFRDRRVADKKDA